MKNRPYYFILYSVLLFAIALSLPMQAALITGRGVLHVFEGFLMLTPLNILLLSLCLLTATLSYNASPMLRVLIPLLLVTEATNNYLIMKSGIGFNSSQVSWATAAFALLHVPLMFGTRKEALLNPGVRWWLVPGRRLINVPINIKTLQGFRFTTRSFDISNNGIFIKIDPEVYCHGQTSFLKSMFSGGRLHLKITAGRFKEIQCEAQVVRCQEKNQGQYPAGLGIRFIDLSTKAKSEITRLLNSDFTEASHLRI